MFKRVLVLVVFLFGVFWWLTSRDETPAENDSEVVTVETENIESEDTDSDTETEVEVESETETEVETNTEETVTPSTETQTTPAPTTSNNNTVDTTTQSETTTNSSSSNNTSASTNTATTTPEPAPTPVANSKTSSTTPMPTTPTAPAVPDRMTDVKVFVYEWGLDLSDKTIPAGTINFQVQNDGRFTHDFNVSGFGNLGKVTPSETRTFTLKLTAGDYEAFSERRQDYERGITETFTVVQ